MTNTNEIDAISFNQDLRNTFLRYLITSNMISDREPELQQVFAQKLVEEFGIIKGPLISCMPCYKPSLSLRELVNGEHQIRPSPAILKVPTEEFDSDRPLYLHQIQAFEHIASGNNLVVATGTGSGKTECFLIPILDSILRDPSPGLRAIIIYPMNALADDQLHRLRRLLTPLPEVTFGRYTGDTPWKLEQQAEREGPANERFTRLEIRQSPPHILLTNFAMLEYLMLRPKDADLFAGQKLSFVVLDEAHTYSGAQGIEIALLMRRLRQYLRRKDGEIKFVLTSATLGDDKNAKKNIADFATDLTGADFHEEDVLEGDSVTWFSAELEDKPTTNQLLSIVDGRRDFQAWTKAALDNDSASLAEMLAEVGLIDGDGTRSASRFLFDVLSRSSLLEKIHELCLERPASVGEICTKLALGEGDMAASAVRWLVTMGSFARRSPDCTPLLPTRLHFFCRGLAGATICLNPDCEGKRDHAGTNWSAFFLEDRQNCPHCDGKVLPVSTCAHCGLPVIRIFEVDGKWKKSPPPHLSPNPRLLTWVDDLEESEDEEAETEVAHLCLACGAYDESGKEISCCGERIVAKLKRIKNAEKSGDLPTCPSCKGGRGTFDSVLREFRTAEDAPSAVLAETIMRNLPYDEKDENKSRLPAHGRNLLVFSDSRQRAAFFAPYLAQTTAETAYLGPLESAVHKAEDLEGRPVTFEEVAREYERSVTQLPFAVLKRTDGDDDFFEIIPRSRIRRAQMSEIRKEAELRLYRNFCASRKQKNTLQGMGIAALKVDFSEHELEAFSSQLPALFTSDFDKGTAILQAFVEIMVQRRAVKFPHHMDAKDIVSDGLGVYTFHYNLSGVFQGRQRFRWNPYSAPEKTKKNAVLRSIQLGILCKALGLDRWSDQSQLSEILERTWDILKDGILVSEDTWHGEYRVDPACLQVTQRVTWHKCDRCGRISALGKIGFCSQIECPGKLHQLDEQDILNRFGMNHYRLRYFLPPLPLRVEEHTAQLTNDLGKEYQKKFMSGEVNVLSSSTTFEMGIDVGQLKCVLLRNVPPTTSSYIQRAGRAGRRKDGVSASITYCRNVPHDQYHFQDPQQMIKGTVPPPYINISNVPLAQRHCNSALLGYFLRDMAGDENPDVDPDKLESITLEQFFRTTYNGRCIFEMFSTWCGDSENATRIGEWLKQIIPKECGLDGETALACCLESLCGEGTSVLKDYVSAPLDRFDEQIQEMHKELSNSTAARRTAVALSLTSLEKLRGQFLDQLLIDFLSSCSWLPGYAFPQDVVKLLVRQPEHNAQMRLERDREIGITEYAPGSEIVANRLLFKSGGIWLKSREPEIRWYARCPECRTIETRLAIESPPDFCKSCGEKLRGKFAARQYIKPDGFTTLQAEKPRMPGMNRKRPARVSEVFLLEGTNEFTPHSIKGIKFGIKEHGKLFRANSNHQYSGFYICRKCGRSLQEVLTKKGGGGVHDSPWGSKCSGTGLKVDLAHEIVTDILQLRFQDCSPKPPPINDRVFWQSFLSAFINGACDALGIARNDLDGTYHGWSEESYIGELVIYDRVPGGAGHISRIVNQLDIVLASTLSRVRDCQCSDLKSSCYACLRSYTNQFYWDQLQREPVIKWLSAVIG